MSNIRELRTLSGTLEIVRTLRVVSPLRTVRVVRSLKTVRGHIFMTLGARLNNAIQPSAPGITGRPPYADHCSAPYDFLFCSLQD